LDKLELPAHLRDFFGPNAFEKIMQLRGKVFRDVVGRHTIQVNLGGSSYFVKQHFGVGWGEIFKNLLSLKKPILGAMTEVQAITKLTEVGIATTPLVGYGVKGCNPATQQSFIITQDLGDIASLEDICADWGSNPPDADFKNNLLIALAQLARRLHGAGLCHRDFYLCHFVLKKEVAAQGQIELILIDLHRMLMGQASHGSAVMKDIAGLYFSTMGFGFTEEDWALFRQHYLPQTDHFWKKVEERATLLYSKFHSDKFQKRLMAEKAAVH
jgi:hypothetical protein